MMNVAYFVININMVALKKILKSRNILWNVKK